MLGWAPAVERACHGHVVAICDQALAAPARDRAWRALMTLIAPRIEAWSIRSPVLRRCNLDGDDDARAVLE